MIGLKRHTSVIKQYFYLINYRTIVIAKIRKTSLGSRNESKSVENIHSWTQRKLKILKRVPPNLRGTLYRIVNFCFFFFIKKHRKYLSIFAVFFFKKNIGGTLYNLTISCGKTNEFTTLIENTKTYKEREDISCLVVGVQNI